MRGTGDVSVSRVSHLGKGSMQKRKGDSLGSSLVSDDVITRKGEFKKILEEIRMVTLYNR